MISFIETRRPTLAYKSLATFITFLFFISVVTPPQISYAQAGAGFPPVPALPLPGTMVTVSNIFTPLMVTGVTVHPDNPLEFDFIVDKGDSEIAGTALEQESKRLVKYFLATLTIPEDELWVNLSPYEQNRMIPAKFGETEMGRDMLAQDYLLKQLTASLMYPENELGKKFWDRVYQKAYDLYGTTEIPMNTFNKIWIVPENATVYQHENSAYVIGSHLKVMLEEDYVALAEQQGGATSRAPEQSDEVRGTTTKESPDTQLKPLAPEIKNSGARGDFNSPIVTQIIKEVLIPAIEVEVNEGATFANLRQIYNSMILATWYKKTLRDSLLGQVYVDRNKVKGVDAEDQTAKEKIYAQYLEAFEKGVYNYIKEDYDPATDNMVPRKYFSGGTEGPKADKLNIKFFDSIPNMTANELVEVLKAKAELTPGEAAFVRNTLQKFTDKERTDILRRLNISLEQLDGKVAVKIVLVENAGEGEKGITVVAKKDDHASSPVQIAVSAYQDPSVLTQETVEIIQKLNAESSVISIFKRLGAVNEHRMVDTLVSIDGTPGYGQVQRKDATAAEKQAYLDSVRNGEWVWLLPAGGDATRLGLGTPKITLDLKKLLSEEEAANLRAAEEKALVKKEITEGQIAEIDRLKQYRDDLRSVSIIGRILKKKAELLGDENALSRQTFIIVPSEGDEQVLAAELKDKNYFDFAREAFVIQPQVKNSMFRIDDAGNVQLAESKKAGGNGVPIIDAALKSKGYLIGENGELVPLEGTALDYARTRNAKYVFQGTIGDLRAWGPDALNEEFAGRVFTELANGSIAAAAEYVAQNPDLIQKGGTVLFDGEKLVFIEKLAMGKLEKTVDFARQPLATFNHIFRLDALETVTQGSLPLYVREDTDENNKPTGMLFTELVGGDILTNLQAQGYEVRHVERPIQISELKGTASLIPTIKAALAQDAPEVSVSGGSSQQVKSRTDDASSPVGMVTMNGKQFSIETARIAIETILSNLGIHREGRLVVAPDGRLTSQNIVSTPAPIVSIEDINDDLRSMQVVALHATSNSNVYHEGVGGSAEMIGAVNQAILAFAHEIAKKFDLEVEGRKLVRRLILPPKLPHEDLLGEDPFIIGVRYKDGRTINHRSTLNALVLVLREGIEGLENEIFDKSASSPVRETSGERQITRGADDASSPVEQSLDSIVKAVYEDLESSSEVVLARLEAYIDRLIYDKEGIAADLEGIVSRLSEVPGKLKEAQNRPSRTREKNKQILLYREGRINGLIEELREEIKKKEELEITSLDISDVKIIEDFIKSHSPASAQLNPEEVGKKTNYQTRTVKLALRQIQGVTYRDSKYYWSKEGAAVSASSPVDEGDKFTKGGIDLNPALLDLQIRRDDNGIPLPVGQQPIYDMHIEGFLPVIINIMPVPVSPMLLGLLGADGSLDAADADTQAAPLDLGMVDKYRDKYIREKQNNIDG